jgi:hypothetical protein
LARVRKLLESLSGASLIAIHILLYPLLRGWRRRWGSTEEERALRLPGDELVPEPQWGYDHAISIDAPRSAVWPWLLQLGQGRGGFYSYEGLENLIGCQVRNVYESPTAARVSAPRSRDWSRSARWCWAVSRTRTARG